MEGAPQLARWGQSRLTSMGTRAQSHPALATPCPACRGVCQTLSAATQQPEGPLIPLRWPPLVPWPVLATACWPHAHRRSFLAGSWGSSSQTAWLGQQSLSAVVRAGFGVAINPPFESPASHVRSPTSALGTQLVAPCWGPCQPRRRPTSEFRLMASH